MLPSYAEGYSLLWDIELSVTFTAGHIVASSKREGPLSPGPGQARDVVEQRQAFAALQVFFAVEE